MRKKRYGPTFDASLVIRGLFLVLIPVIFLTLAFHFLLLIFLLFSVLVSRGKNIFYRNALIRTFGNALLQICFFFAALVGVLIPRMGMLLSLGSYLIFSKEGYKMNPCNQKILMNLANLSTLFDLKKDSL